MHATGWLGMWMWVFWLLITIAFVVWIRPLITPEGRSGDAGASAQEILKERFARGEIDRERYQRSLEDLRR